MLALFSREHALSFQPQLTYLGRPVIFRTQFGTCLSGEELRFELSIICSHVKVLFVLFFFSASAAASIQLGKMCMTLLSLHYLY